MCYLLLLFAADLLRFVGYLFMFWLRLFALDWCCFCILVLVGLVFSFEFDAVGECWFGLIVIVLHIYFILFVWFCSGLLCFVCLICLVSWFICEFGCWFDVLLGCFLVLLVLFGWMLFWCYFCVLFSYCMLYVFDYCVCLFACLCVGFSLCGGLCWFLC